MTYHWTVPLLAAVLNAALAAVVLHHSPRNPLNRVFALLSLTLVSWNLNIFFLYFLKNADAAMYWSDAFRVGTLMSSAVASHLFVVFSESRSKRLWGLLGASYALSLFLVAANAHGDLVSGLRTYAWGFYPIGTPLYELLPISVAFNLCIIIGVFVHVLRKSESPRKRQQARLWIAGAVIAMPLGMTNLIATFGVPFYPLGNLANVVYTGIVAYAIVRHRLMDIDLAITKGMAYVAGAFVLIAPAFVMTLWLQRLSFGHIHPDFSFAVLVMMVAVGVFFPALRFRAESRIRQSLFREKHEHRAALVAFTRSIVRILDRDKLVHELGTVLGETLQLDRVAITLADEAKGTFTVRYAVGTAPLVTEFPEEHAFIPLLKRCQDAVLRDEIEATGDATERAAVDDVCKRNGWEVCIPLSVGGKLIGFIGLGRKRNLDTFFAEDLELLGTLGAEASVGLENARLYEELRRSQDIIQRADRLSALGTLAAGIAHEVRNPLVSIQTFFQLAPERLNDREFFTEFLDMTAEEVKRIANLISELLTFARSPTRALGPVDLNQTVERVVTLLEPEARKQKLSLTYALSPTAPHVHADGDQIKQVLLNLVLNAIQATAPGGGVAISSRPVQHRDAPFCQLEIRDTGIGIPHNRIDDIFTPFFTTKDQGTGLGLAIAHQIVAEHGGFISVDSKEGHGTSFFIDLPAFDHRVTADDSTPQTEIEDLPHRYGRARKLAS